VTDAPRRVAYLVNRYPAVSHTFIRREIAGVEACGVEVLRYSVRPAGEESLVHPEDRDERARTRVLLEEGVAAFAWAVFSALLARPLRFARALGAAWRLGGRSPQGRLRHLAYVAEACLLVRRLRRAGASHLHAHFGTNPAAVAMLCRILGGPPYSFTAHGSELFADPGAHSIGEKVAHSAFAVAVCEFGRSRMASCAAPSDAGRLRVVRCGVDRAYLEARPVPPPGRPRLVCVGRLSEEKGHLVLLEAAAALRAAGRALEVALVGDGPLRAALEARIRALGLEAVVKVCGAMDGDGVRREIEAARALVLPSFGEGLPVVIMEAFALGRPVIATAVAGIPELVEPGRSGWLVPPGSAEALASAMAEVLDAPATALAAMGACGRAAVLERHDAAREAARLAAWFRGEEGGP
jgi:colanic acid/amylovoran biosynthesis glycosyltransferase